MPVVGQVQQEKGIRLPEDWRGNYDGFYENCTESNFPMGFAVAGGCFEDFAVSNFPMGIAVAGTWIEEWRVAEGVSQHGLHEFEFFFGVYFGGMVAAAHAAQACGLPSGGGNCVRKVRLRSSRASSQWPVACSRRHRSRSTACTTCSSSAYTSMRCLDTASRGGRQCGAEGSASRSSSCSRWGCFDRGFAYPMIGEATPWCCRSWGALFGGGELLDLLLLRRHRGVVPVSEATPV